MCISGSYGDIAVTSQVGEGKRSAHYVSMFQKMPNLL